MNTKRDETVRNFDIVAGPNRDMLFDACKYAYDKMVQIPIDFIVAIGYTMPKHHPGCAYIPMYISDIKVVSIEHENGSGESFNLRGFCKADPDSTFGNAETCTSYNFKAYYNTKNRSGCITFSK